jgi:predicted nucleotidyltransferase
VLRTLCDEPGRAYTAPELARLGRLSLSHVQLSLTQLEAQGFVDRQVSGRRHLWTVAKGNALLPPLCELFERERQLPEELIAEIRRALSPLNPSKAIVFGSVVRGDESGWSDVDLLFEVVSEAERERTWDALLRLGRTLRERYGLTLSPLVVTKAEALESLSKSFLARIKSEGVSVAR